jgi:NADH-quinone oxidoreductase subunit L
MLNLCWLIPAFPLAGFLVLALLGPRMPKPAAASIGVLSVALAALVSILIGVDFLTAPPPGNAFTQLLWQWIELGRFRPEIALRLDSLSLTMTSVVTFVGFLIHLYSAEHMRHSEGYSRFFAYMNLFVGSMTTLVLADNLLLLYMGWEGVGLCSYLLIGFWYGDSANGVAAQKAFIVTRVGDTALAVGLFLIFSELGTLRIQEVAQTAAMQWPTGSGLAIAASALILGGAIGKSAQLPLQVWLPDAMAGPTPTSALIHAATMVTAGVYLIARTHVLFELAPPVQLAVAVIGAATLLVGGLSAAAQRDIKRVLAYSTISQIGYMFLALGVGAWAAAIFHFWSHAFFKALLFLAAGVVIQALHEEHDIYKMGGLRKELPIAFWAFLIGGCSLAGLPLLTAGFYSKGLVLWGALSGKNGSFWLWLAGTIGVLITSLYIFRVIALVFFGERKRRVGEKPGPAVQIALVVLSALAIAGGWVDLPSFLGGSLDLSRFLETTLPGAMEKTVGGVSELWSEVIITAAFALGLWAAIAIFGRRQTWARSLLAASSIQSVERFLFSDWGFDWAYDRLFVRPYRWIAQIDKGDVIDLLYASIAKLGEVGHRVLSLTQTGRLRWYMAWLAAGTIIFVAVVLLQ